MLWSVAYTVSRNGFILVEHVLFLFSLPIPLARMHLALSLISLVAPACVSWLCPSSQGRL